MSALTERISRAYHDNSTFRVIIVMPLKPEFYGDWGGYQKNGLFLREVTRLNFATLFRGENSLRGRLMKNGGC